MVKFSDTQPGAARAFLDPQQHPVAVAAVAFVLFSAIHVAVPDQVARMLSAVLLALVGGAYIGFAAHAVTTRAFWLEMVTALLFALFAFLGLLVHWVFLPLGLALHAVWDLLHHLDGFGARVPRWYIPFCAVFDTAAAVLLTILFLM